MLRSQHVTLGLQPRSTERGSNTKHSPQNETSGPERVALAQTWVHLHKAQSPGSSPDHVALRRAPVQAEDELAKLVVVKAVAAKIDRPAGVVTFGARQRPDDVLNSWSSNIDKLLGLVETSCQQIQKECMVHKVPLTTLP